MSDFFNSNSQEEEQQKFLNIQKNYFDLKNKHKNLKSLVEIKKRESTRFTKKASIIYLISFFALATLIGSEFPNFIDGWFALYFIGGIALYIFIILIGCREHDNIVQMEREVYYEMYRAEKEYEKIKDKILKPSLSAAKQGNQDSLSVVKEKLRPYFKASAALSEEPDTTKLLSLLDKYPEFSNGKFYDMEFIDGGWKNVFKENLPYEIKRELKQILPKQLYDELNYKSKK